LYACVVIDHMKYHYLCLQGTVEQLLNILKTSEDEAFINTASTEVEKLFKQFYVDALDTLAKDLSKKLHNLIEVLTCSKTLAI
jgi:hypothetical protein